MKYSNILPIETELEMSKTNFEKGIKLQSQFQVHWTNHNKKPMWWIWIVSPLNCVKSARIRNFSGPYFACSFQMWKNKDQKTSNTDTFLAELNLFL